MIENSVIHYKVKTFWQKENDLKFAGDTNVILGKIREHRKTLKKPH